MTTFTDGPAAGKRLELLRMSMPLFLRVTRDKAGVIDALDQLSDEPKSSEELFAYIKTTSHGTVHLDGRDKKGKRFGQWYEMCEYSICESQPNDMTMRSNDSWAAWCKDEAAKIKAEREEKKSGEPTNEGESK